MKKLLSVLFVALMCFQMTACSSAPTECTHDLSQYVTKQEYDALMEKYEKAQSDLSTAKTNYDTIKSDYDAAKAQYEETKAAYDTLSTDMESTAAERDTALENYETAKAEYDTLKAEYDAAKAEYETLQTSFESLQAEYNTVKAEYDTLKNSFESLQAEYNALKEYVDENMDPIPTTPPAGSFNPDEVLTQLEITEYIYAGDWFSCGFLSIKNNSAYNIRIDASVKMYDAEGNLIGAKSNDVSAFEAGTETLLSFYADEEFASMTYELTVELEDYYDCVVSNLTYETVSAKNKEIVSVTNNGKKAADFVAGHILFFKGNEIVGYTTTYFVDNDDELKAGKTITKEMECYEDYDSFLLFFTGRRS